MIEPGEDLERRMRRYKMVFEQDPAARSTLEVLLPTDTCGMSFDSP